MLLKSGEEHNILQKGKKKKNKRVSHRIKKKKEKKGSEHPSLQLLLGKRHSNGKKLLTEREKRKDLIFAE